MTTYGIDRSVAAGGTGGSTTALLADGSQPLTADWDAGNFSITALSFIASGANPTFELIRALDTQANAIEFQEADGSVRWKLNHAGTGSSNDFSLQRYNASGVLQDSPISVANADGLVTVTDVALSQSIYLTGLISPTQLSANTNDWAPTSFADSNTIRVTSDSARNLTGIAAGSAGRVILLHNVGSYEITLVDESSSSTAANRFALAADHVLRPDTSVLLVYDGTSSRWRVVGASDMPSPVANTYPRRNSGNTAYTAQTPQQVADEVAPLTYMPGRNFVVNGDCQIDQRGLGTVTLTGSNQYIFDRWKAAKGTAGATVSAVIASVFASAGTNAPGGSSTKAFSFTVSGTGSPAAGEANYIELPLEGLDMARAGFGQGGTRTVTLSFFIYPHISGTISGSIRNTGTGGFRAYPWSASVTANQWQRVVVHIPVDTSGTWPTDTSQWGSIFFDLGSGSSLRGTAGAWAGSNLVGETGASNFFGTTGTTYITLVQLEMTNGTYATPFEHLPHSEMLRRCQRYYYRIGGAASGIPRLDAYGGAGQVLTGQMIHPVTMRTAPIGSKVGTWTVSNCGQPAISGTTAQGFHFAATVTATGGIVVYPSGSGDYFAFEADF